MQKITPFLWFDGNAEKPPTFTSPSSRTRRWARFPRYGDAGPGPRVPRFRDVPIEAQEFFALTAGPQFKFTRRHLILRELRKPSRKWTNFGRNSLRRWPNGTAAAAAGQVRPLLQIIPTVLGQLLATRSQRATRHAGHAAMTKIDIKKLQAAAAEAESTATSGG